MLSPGTRVGPYEVTGSLGKGGMGEVHRARDERLGRDVALKVLPDDVASDRDRMARFEREARLLASLNHPHIAAIYGVEDAGSTHALVMELAEGPTLLERMSQGPIPVDEALDVARQMAEALEYAHERGVIHRDLKPANVKVTPEGEVKLLDFGLAKAFEGDEAQPRGDFRESPTISHQGTRAGVILGTASYMSPEQARGKAVDRRTDIWAFGVVLLEMLTGRSTFTGESLTDVLAAVVSSDPDLGALPSGTPPAVRRLLRRCLDKDAKHRLRDIGEARILLEDPAGAVDAPPATGRRGRAWPLQMGGAAALLLLGVIVGFFADRLTSHESRGNLAVRQITFRRGSIITARFAPDGQTVIYGGTFDGEPLEVYSLRVDTRESRPLGLTGANVLAVSSSGELALSLGHRYTRGFESTGTLARVPLGGAAAREVLEGVEGADWAPDGQSLAVVRPARGRRRLEFPIGTVLHDTGGWISNPRVSPDGRHVAFLDHPDRGDNTGAVTVVDREGQSRVLARTAHNGIAWSPSGEEVFHLGTDSSLWATRLSGQSRLLFQTLGAVSIQDVAADGRILLTNRMWQREMVGRGPGDSGERNLSWGDWSFPSFLSSDGRTVLFEEQRLVTDGDYGLFLRPTDGSPPVRLGDGRAFALSPDGRWVLAASQAGGTVHLWLLPTGVGEAKRLFSLDAMPSAAGFLPDGERLALSASVAGEGTRLYVHDLSGGPPRAISPEGVTSSLRRMFVPDGRFVLAHSPEGPLTLYPIDEGEPRVVPGTSLEDMPVGWHEDGRTLFVQRPTGLPARIEEVNIETGERRLWKELIPPDPAGVSVIGPTHVSADGRTYVYSYRRVLDRLAVVEGLW